jgi:hypothetical protein
MEVTKSTGPAGLKWWLYMQLVEGNLYLHLEDSLPQLSHPTLARPFVRSIVPYSVAGHPASPRRTASQIQGHGRALEGIQNSSISS